MSQEEIRIRNYEPRSREYPPADIQGKNVLLIYPTIIGEIPMSLAQVSSVFESEGFNVHNAVNTFKKPLTNKDFLDIATEVEADIIGISTLTFEIKNTYKLIKSFKDQGYTVIVGGPHASTQPEEVIINGADIVVRNEGEESIKELCKFWKGEIIKRDQDELNRKWNERVDSGLKVPDLVADNFSDGLGSILGITYFDKVEQKIRSNPPRKRITDLASLPKPNYDLFDHSLFTDAKGLIRGTHRIFTTRGCPAKCTFCDWGVFGQRVTFQNMRLIVEEIQRRVDQYGTTNFFIADDVFTVNKKHVSEFCKEVVKVRPRIEWQAQTRAEFVDEEMLIEMKEAGCYMVGFGLESGDQESLRRMDKRVDVETNIKATKLAAKVGLKVYANLMIGFPWETPKHIDNTLNMVREIWDDVFIFQVSGSLIPFPGTRIYEEYVKEYPNLKDYWLNDNYQQYGIQTYQNNAKPYKMSTYYQRNLFDDTYIRDENFFTYTEEFKKKVGEFVFEIGHHNLRNVYPDRYKLLLYYAKISYFLYLKFPKLEKIIVGNFYSLLSIITFSKKIKRSTGEEIRNDRRGMGKVSGNEWVTRKLAASKANKVGGLSYEDWV